MTSLSVNAYSFASDQDGRSGTSATFNRNEDGQLTLLGGARSAGFRSQEGHGQCSHRGLDRADELRAAVVASVRDVLKFRGKQGGRNRLHRHPMPALGARHHEGRETGRRCDRMSHCDATLVPSIRPLSLTESSRFCAAHTNLRQCGMPKLD